MLLASLLGTPGGILLFLPIYHPLHDFYNIHSEVTFFILFSFVLSIIWLGSRIEKNKDLPFYGKLWNQKVQIFAFSNELNRKIYVYT